MRIYAALCLLSIFPMFSKVSGEVPNQLIPSLVYDELRKFSFNGKGLDDGYIKSFPQKIHGAIMNDMKKYLKSLNGSCKDSVKVTFDARVTSDADPTTAAFESGLIKVETSQCFEDSQPQELIEIDSNHDFKMKVFSTLKKIKPEDSKMCEWTSSLIGKSHYCYESKSLEESQSAITRIDFLTYNDPAEVFDAPVAFREALISARRIGGSTLLYVHSYVRANPLSAFARVFAEKMIESTQNKYFTEMRRIINASKKD